VPDPTSVVEFTEIGSIARFGVPPSEYFVRQTLGTGAPTRAADPEPAPLLQTL